MPPPLQLHLLGPLEITLGRTPVAFRYDKLRALLVYLAVERGRPHAREALVGLLWPEAPDADARRNLSQALFNLRQALGEGSGVPAPVVPFLLASRETLQFNPESDYTLDVADFQDLLAAARTHTHASPETCAECADRLAQAVAMYRGDFLHNFYLPDTSAFEEWALLKREDLRRQALSSLAHLTAYFEAQTDFEKARQYARRQLVLEPWREEAHRDLMRLLALSGERSAALAQFETCRKVLADELGVGPSPETEQLVEQIKTGQWSGKAGTEAVDTGASAPAAAPAPPGARLPAPLTAFVGREQELAEIGRLLADPNCRLLTLTGPGGIGKTRLAIQTAVTHRAAFEQGAAWVPLAPVNNAEHLFTAIAAALGVTLLGGAEPAAQLLHHLRDKRLLLVLDNFEHLLGDAASPTWLTELLAGAPGLKLLVTSREVLGLQGEWAFAVEGLGDEAVDLFVQSARRARAGFELQAADLAAVDRICALLGATPLAVELAAAWVRVLTCREIAEEIERALAGEQPLNLLATQARDVPERHRSMATVFEHSWRLLPAEERSVLGRLAVFRGGFGREAAEHVAGASLTVLSALSAKSLLRRVAHGRYDLHELVRQYAAGKLAQSPEALAHVYDAHAAYYARFLSERAEDLRGARQREAAHEVAGELDNVRAAWHWAVEHGRLVPLRQMALPVYLFCQRRSRYREGSDLLTQAITRVEADPSAEAQEAVAGFVLGRGWLGIRLGQLSAAEADFQRAEALYTRLNRLPHIRMIGDPTMALGLIASIRGDYAAATRHYEAALEVIAQHGDHQALAYPHLYLASIQRALGNAAAAERYARQAYTLAEAAGQPWVMGFVLNELGQTALAAGDHAAALSHLQAAYALREKLDDASGMALDLSHLGQVALARGELAEAEQLFQRSLALYRDIGDQGGRVTALHGLGRTALATGQAPAAWGHLVQALETAHRANFVPVTLSVLVSLAEALAASGSVERARRLLTVILSQPTYERETRRRAEGLCERLGGTPSAEPDSRPGADDLAGTITTLLAEPHLAATESIRPR